MNDLIDRLRGADPTLGRQLPAVTLEAVRERASAPLLVQSESRLHSKRALAVVGVLCVLSALGFLLARRVAGPGTGSNPRERYAVFMAPEATDAQVKAVADLLRTAGISYRYVGKEEALAEFRQLYAKEPAVADVAVAANMPTSFRLREADITVEQYGATLTAIARLPGFASVSSDVNGPPPPTTPPPTEAPSTSPICPSATGTPGVGTLYLGGPAWDQNAAAKGFIYSLPQGPGAVAVAEKAIALPIIGGDCDVVGEATATADVVSVSVAPPSVPSPLVFTVKVAESDGIVGVTDIRGSTTFTVSQTAGTPALKLLAGMPESAQRVGVRFKKGDDVWELTAPTQLDTDIPLSIPSGETDRFPTAPVDWVLFTVVDAGGRVVAAGGTAL